MIGLSLLKIGLDGLGETLVRAAPGELDLDAIAKDLDKVVADRPGLPEAMRGERLMLGSFVAPFGRVVDEPFLMKVIGDKLLLELGVVELDAIERDIETALALQDAAARDKALDEIQARVEAEWNPFVKMAVPNMQRVAEQVAEHDGALAVLRTAIALEKARAADGTYPETIELPLDPATGKPLGFTRSEDKKSWTLSSKKLTLSRP
jgi:hypothetical protein